MRRRSDEPKRDVTAHLQPLVDDDVFLTALSEGTDPSDGADPLAALLLEMRSEVERQMPPAPVIDGGEAEGGVVDLGEDQKRHRAPGPLVSGFIGAAAATAVLAGTGAALYNATPDSPLWGPSTALFGERASVVELASTLDELEVASEKGDVAGTRDLLNQARSLIDALGAPRAQTDERMPAEPAPTPVTVTVTQTEQRPAAEKTPEPSNAAPEPAEPAPAVTQTQTLVQTQTVTVTVTQPPAQPAASDTPEPEAPSPVAGARPATPQAVAEPGTANAGR